MINSIKDKLFFIVVCLLWYYVGKSSPTIGMVLVVVSFLLFVAKEMFQEQLFSLLFLIVLSDNYSLFFAQTIKPIILILITLNVFMNKEIGMKAPLHKAFVPFFILATLTLFLSPKLDYSFQRYSSYLLLFISIPSYTLFLYKKYKAEFFKNLIYLMVVLIVISLLAKYINPGYAISHGGRLRGMFGNPNGYAIYCVFAVMIFEIARNYIGCVFSKWEIIFIYAVLLLSVWWTGSRSALIATSIFFLFTRINKLSPFLGFFILIIIIVTYQYIVVITTDILSDFGLAQQLRLKGEQGIETGSGRLVAWTFAWQEIQKNFLLGLGWSYDEILFEDPKVQEKLNALNHQGGVHNSYLIFWLNQGIIGVFAFFTPLIGSFIKASKKSIYALPLMYSCFFMANFEPWLGSSLNPYTILLVIMLTTFIFIDIDEEEEQEQEEELQPPINA